MKKALVFILSMGGYFVGSLLPWAWDDAGMFSVSSLLLGTAGGVAGAYIGYRLFVR